MSTTVQSLDVESGSAPLVVNLPPEPRPSNNSILKPIPETTVSEKVVGVIGIGAAATALGAMIAELFEGVVVVAGLLSILMAGYAYYQEVQLTDIKALKQTRKVIAAEVDRLESENKRLSTSVEDLSSSVENLSDVKDALEKLQKLQGQSVKAFAEQVEGYKSVLQGMERNLKGQVIGNIMSVVTRSDTDQDFMFSSSEVDEMLKKINGLYGVRVNEKLFRAMVTGKSVHSAMDLVDNLFEDERLPADQRIFIIEQQQ